MTPRRANGGSQGDAAWRAFAPVRTIGLTLPEVEATTRYDGSPVLKLRGCFMAGLATDGSTEAGTLVVRCREEDRECLLEDAPGTYYVTDFYRRYPLVLVRLSQIHPDALREVLQISWRLTAVKAKPSSQRRARSGSRLQPHSTAEIRPRRPLGG